jgi:hypothetical protein
MITGWPDGAGFVVMLSIFMGILSRVDGRNALAVTT